MKTFIAALSIELFKKTCSQTPGRRRASLAPRESADLLRTGGGARAIPNF
ncbi:MAG TPA: hypothetical protein VGB17_19090 [Pyrinomonadaceae bacterium]|jgi:hypothetical protein